MPLQVPQGINISNGFLQFERTNGQSPPVAPVGAVRLSLGTDGILKSSVSGGAYGAAAESGGSLVLTAPAAATTPLTVNAHASQSADVFLVQASSGADFLRVTAAGLSVAGVAGSTPTHKFEVQGAANDFVSSAIRVRNNNATSPTATRGGITMETASSSGFLAAYHSGHSTTALADSFVLGTNSDAAHLILAAESGSQTIRFRVPTTGQILSLGAGALTVAAGGHFVFSTTGAGTQLGTAADQLVSFHGATAVAQIAGITQTYATATGTHADPTAATLTVADGAGTNDGTIGAITADASVIAAIQELADQHNKTLADLLNLKQFVNFNTDGLQTKGLFA